MKKLFAFIGLLGVVYALAVQHGVFPGRPAGWGPAASGAGSAQLVAPAPPAGSCDDELLARAYRSHQSRVEVCSHGTVAKVLKDDQQGARHQRFIVRLPSGRTLLVAYNIDVARRIEGLRAGSEIEFTGEYEWNEQGGVVHWTHRDPGGRHPAGWIRYEGRTYQ